MTGNHPEHPLAGPEDWDALINDPFNIGPPDRTTKADDWWVLTGMHVRLPDALAGRPAGTSKLLVCADTISVGKAGVAQLNWNGWTDVLLIGASVNRYNGCTFHRDLADSGDKFRIAVSAQSSEHFQSPDARWVITTPAKGYGRGDFDMGDGRRPVQTEIYMSYAARGIYSTAGRQEGLQHSGPGFDACRPFLARLLLAAQSLFGDKRAAQAGQLLDRLQAVISSCPGAPAWQDVWAQAVATRELFQPLRPAPDHVPYLRPDVYGGVASAYGPVLKAYADTFQQFTNRAFDVGQRRRAAQLILDEKGDAMKFQDLVGKQLSENLNIATDNAEKAKNSMQSQQARVARAEAAFQSGLASWKKKQEQEAAMAIAGSVFSFVAGVASMFAGNPAGAAGAAEAAQKAATTAQKLADLMKKLAKLVQVIAKVVEMCQKIARAAAQITNAKEFADRMADVRREAESGGLADAPSAAAYWDQLWLEVETLLALPVNEGIGRAAEYLKELKVMIVYGRALTAAQAAIPPIAQESARSATRPARLRTSPATCSKSPTSRSDSRGRWRASTRGRRASSASRSPSRRRPSPNCCATGASRCASRPTSARSKGWGRSGASASMKSSSGLTGTRASARRRARPSSPCGPTAPTTTSAPRGTG